MDYMRTDERGICYDPFADLTRKENSMIKPTIDIVPTPSFSNERLQAAGFSYVDPYVESFLRKQAVSTEVRSVSTFAPSKFASLEEVKRELQDMMLVPASAAHLVQLALNDPTVANIAALEPVFHHDEYGPQMLMILVRNGGRALVLEPLPERWPLQLEVLVYPS